MTVGQSSTSQSLMSAAHGGSLQTNYLTYTGSRRADRPLLNELAIESIKKHNSTPFYCLVRNVSAEQTASSVSAFFIS